MWDVKPVPDFTVHRIQKFWNLISFQIKRVLDENTRFDDLKINFFVEEKYLISTHKMLPFDFIVSAAFESTDEIVLCAIT